MPNVTVYSTPTCPWCHKTKQYLTAKNIPFTDINVAADQQKAQEMIAKSGQMGVPVIEIDGNIVVGYDQAKINKLLGL
ncbi:MAG: glutaredoxin family protein [Candidatus Magasanikbacteria bacterium]|nr:glutaredoxin family protein [Candidatus Magasanikbacteria bacterium]